MPNESFPLTLLQTRKDWGNYTNLLQNLLEYSKERDQYRDSIKSTPDAAERLHNEMKLAAAELYYRVNEAGLWENGSIKWHLRQYAAIFHPDSVSMALTGSDRVLSGEKLNSSEKAEVNRLCQEVFKCFSDPLSMLPKLTRNNLDSASFARNAGNPYEVTAAAVDDVETESESESDDPPPPEHVNLQLIEKKHRAYQKGACTPLAAAYQAFKNGTSGSGYKTALLSKNAINKKYNEEKGFDQNLGMIPLDSIYGFWQNPTPESKTALRGLLEITQVSLGLAEQPPVYDSHGFPDLVRLAKLNNCDPQTGIKLQTVPPPTTQVQQPTFPPPTTQAQQPTFPPPTTQAQQPPLTPQPSRFTQAPIPSSSPWARGHVFGQPTPTLQSSILAHPNPSLVPSQRPNSFGQSTILTQPNLSAQPKPSHWSLPSNHHGDPFKTSLTLPSALVSTDEIVPGRTIQGHIIRAWKQEKGDLKSTKYVVEISPNHYQYRSQAECGGGAVWWRLQQNNLVGNLLQIDAGTQPLLENKSRFEQYGFGLDFIAFPSTISTIPTRRPASVVGGWYYTEERQIKKVAFMWSTFVRILGHSLANDYTTLLLERGCGVEPDSFKMGGIWDALEHIDPRVKRPNGLSRPQRQALLLHNGDQQRQIQWSGPSGNYASSLLAEQNEIVRQSPYSAGQSPPMALAHTGPEPGIFKQVVDTTILKRSFPCGYHVLDANSPGDPASGGLRALWLSMKAQGSVDIVFEDLVTLAQNAPLQFDEHGNLTEFQLNYILQQWGHQQFPRLELRLAYVLQSSVDTVLFECDHKGQHCLYVWIHGAVESHTWSGMSAKIGSPSTVGLHQHPQFTSPYSQPGPPSTQVPASQPNPQGLMSAMSSHVPSAQPPVISTFHLSPQQPSPEASLRDPAAQSLATPTLQARPQQPAMSPNSIFPPFMQMRLTQRKADTTLQPTPQQPSIVEIPRFLPLPSTPSHTNTGTSSQSNISVMTPNTPSFNLDPNPLAAQGQVTQIPHGSTGSSSNTAPLQPSVTDPAGENLID